MTTQNNKQRMMDALKACADIAKAEEIVRGLIGQHVDKVSRDDVLLPLARSLLKSSVAAEERNAVGEAGNAVESFLANLAGRMGVSLIGAAGINQKLDKFRPGDHLPKKVVEAAKYLGQVRNAADHGVDTDVNAQWSVSPLTAKTYPVVACAFIGAALAHEHNKPYCI